jgi:hypothetical protein
MSVSGVGNGNSWFPDWASLNKPRGESAAQKASASAGVLGQEMSANGLGQAAGVQSVTSASGAQMNQQDSNSFGQSMSTLAQAIQGGDVESAQDAFAKAKALLGSSGVHGHHHHHHAGAKPAATADPNASTGSTDPFATAFAAIGQSLQSGDLAGARSALTSLDSLLQGAARKLTRPPIGANGPANPPGSAIDLTA